MARLIIRAWNHEREIPSWRTYEEPKLLATLEVVGRKLTPNELKKWGYEDDDTIYQLHKNVSGIVYVMITPNHRISVAAPNLLAPWSQCDYLTVQIV